MPTSQPQLERTGKVPQLTRIFFVPFELPMKEIITIILYKFATRGERILFFGSNTNTNNIRNQILDQIRIRIIFVFSE